MENIEKNMLIYRFIKFLIVYSTLQCREKIQILNFRLIFIIKTFHSITSGKYKNSPGFAVCWMRANLVLAASEEKHEPYTNPALHYV